MGMNGTLIMVMAVALGGCGHARRMDLVALVHQSRELSPDLVSTLEARLERHPKDLEARAQLIGYFEGQQFRSAEGRQAHARHALWVIRESPRSVLAGQSAIKLDPRSDRKSYDAAVGLWREHLAEASFDAALYENAARFLMPYEKDMVVDILTRAAAADARDPRWPELLGQSLWLHRPPASSNEGWREAASLSYAAYERSLVLKKKEIDKFYMLDEAAETAVAAGLSGKARAHAEQLLALAPGYKDNWNYGNAVHDAHAVLGLVALSEGDVAEAKARLLKAGATPGSPQLDSFGPNVTLARELLARGEREAVLSYFELCRKFWVSGAGTLTAWSVAVQKGETPDFGANAD